ncbi:ABC transporter permease [Arthrobacter sp. SDTb3-6]|uniref:ABC transporter permease n=1 Tax=Arthrobacter sp. SDTb3-6 TaxID=2713571 RepID=UPI00159E8E8D|nr:ABC transporter permease subunit [Arthrobacter sp. SDTb3-6]NVM98112.1 ABC transporter permease subunit [Arthrobacter sp. SDTb3-6]
MKETTTSPRLLLAQRVAAILILLGIWWLVIASGAVPSMLPGVSQILAAIGKAFVSAAFWGALGKTLLAALSGWAIAAVVGVVAGLVIGSINFLDRSTSILVDFGRSFPVLALMPVVIMLLGSNARMEIVVVALSCLWPVLVQTVYGARRQEAAVSDTVAVFRIPPLLRFRRVLLPSALPFIATGVRISASVALLIAVGVEVISQAPGIGRQITLMQQEQRWDMAFAYLFFTGMVGWAMAAVLQRFENRLLIWKRQEND